MAAARLLACLAHGETRSVCCGFPIYRADVDSACRQAQVSAFGKGGLLKTALRHTLGIFGATQESRLLRYEKSKHISQLK